ncbi:MAG: ABC transporter transmembrane domain-containing protein [Flavobacteriales bacterium]|nr:ABC transporter transmembrane domain-containing protein [Flavobacteriales bacterium]
MESPRTAFRPTRSLKNIRRLFAYLKPYRWHFAGGLAALFVSSITSLALFNHVGHLIDAQSGDSVLDTGRVVLWLGGILVVQALASFARIRLFAHVTENTVAALRQDAFSSLILKPMVFFSEKRVGEITSRLSADITSIKDTLTSILAEFIREIIIISGSVLIMAWTSWQLVLFMLGALPLMAGVAVVFGRRIRALSKEAQQQAAEANTIVEEALQAIASVKAYTGELFEMARYGKKNEAMVQLGLRNAGFRALFATLVVVLLFGAVVAIVGFGASLVAQGLITHGDLFKFFLLSVFMGASIGGLAETWGGLQKALGATESLFELMDFPPEYPTGAKKPEPGAFNLRDEIHFQNVSFAYPTRPDKSVIQNLNLHLPAGKITALVGPSGAGKTTLTALLLRFYEPNEGLISVGGTDIRQMDLALYRSRIAIVPQDIVLFGGTVFENILYARPEARREEVEEAARKAHAHEFISTLPQGYDTVVGERGTQLSGGQRQRVAMARAFLKNPDILILDEATSALDSVSEAMIQDALALLMQGRTTLVVAHRLSTIRQAHQILVLDKGRLVEHGTHDQLIARPDGLYAHLFALQSRHSVMALGES